MAWAVLGLGGFVWCKEQVCEVMEQSCGGMLAVVYVFGGGTGAAQSAVYKRTDAVVRFTFDDAPTRVDSAAKTAPLTLSVDCGETIMLCEVSAASESKRAASSDDSDWKPYRAAALGQIPTTDIGEAGIIDHGCVAEAHQQTVQ